jgi:hypothetical protein
VLFDVTGGGVAAVALFTACSNAPDDTNSDTIFFAKSSISMIFSFRY